MKIKMYPLQLLCHYIRDIALKYDNIQQFLVKILNCLESCRILLERTYINFLRKFKHQSILFYYIPAII